MTIRGKMIGIGLLVAAGLLGLCGLMQYSIGVVASAEKRVEEATRYIAQREGELKEIENFRYILLCLNLNAMDSIIDRDEGAINPERLAEIGSNSSKLREKSASMFAVADTAEEKQAAADVKKAVEDFSHSVAVDLKAAIERFGKATTEAAKATLGEAFAKIDNDLDAAAVTIYGKLEILANSIGDEVKNARAQGDTALKEMIEAEDRALWLSWILGLSMTVLIMVIFTVFARGILQPLKQGVAFAEALGVGDLSQRLRLERKDEFGILGGALDRAADSLSSRAEIATAIAAGDLTREVTVIGEKDTLGLAFKTMIQNLTQVLSGIQVASREMSNGASQVSDASQSLSQGATESAAALEEITSSVTEIGSQTKHNAESAQQANQLSTAARGAAEKGSERMGDMVEAMGEINASSQQIAKIIKVIDDIAF
ncbi:MAG: HAMP domain-containing protein, partial [Planctomycetes bacterium]|nr:HAMP domain-containing protein [Planctomycetota bacterium]